MFRILVQKVRTIHRYSPNFVVPNQIQLAMRNALDALNSHLMSLDITGGEVHYNLTPSEYENYILKDEQSVRTNLGAVAIKTGKFTGRSPKDRYIVDDSFTKDVVDWGNINQAISENAFRGLKKELSNYLSRKELFVHDAFVCADNQYELNIRTVAEKAYSALFASNMFRNCDVEKQRDFNPQWTILCAPDYHADTSIYTELRATNFAIINFTEKMILIGGTGYTGEIKKGIFSVLNTILPKQKGVLPMHCSANVSLEGDSTIFFGLSGTGKTTLSADKDRLLIGDDEHGWGEDGVFNFEGGCYAKTINLSEEGEPQIFHAIKEGALLENIGIGENGEIDFADNSITENTRVSYPLEHIPEAKNDSKAGHPKHIFFLTCDAFGVLPPISKLTKEQAMYYFISGYTAKIAGTELGITEPQATFSACFGAPFLPLHPTKYATMLGEKMDQHEVKVWLVNTGWVGGAYGVGHRISLKYTRAMITAAQNGELQNVEFEKLDGFDLAIPKSCSKVPSKILNPKANWIDEHQYDLQAQDLIKRFQKNFLQFNNQTSHSIAQAGPKSTTLVS